jgi:hypothetical protein
MKWRTLAEERVDLPLVVVVRPFDSFLRRPATVPVQYELRVSPPVGQEPTSDDDLGTTAVRTPSGHVVFPRLRLPRSGPETYQLRPVSAYVVPIYPPGASAFEFTLGPGASPGVVDVVLHPGPNYPYSSHVCVAHGQVREGDAPAGAAVVSSSAGDRCATDDGGRFSLGLRAVRGSQPVSVIAITRTGRSAKRDFPNRDAAVTGHIAIQVPTQ